MHEFNDMLATLASAAFVGVMLLVIASKLRIPAIVPLLFGGVLVGPEFLGLVQPEALGESLRTIILIAVAVILFEGGLTLNPSGFQRAPVVIRRLLTVGVLITWAGVSAALYFLMDLPLDLAALGGSLVIVTGPTVVSPLLRRIRLDERLDSILRWEGVLIDPVGVFVAVVLFDYVTVDPDPSQPFVGFILRVAIGVAVGGAAGLALDLANRRSWIPREMLNLVALTSAIFAFWLSELMAGESGLLTVVVMGFVLAVRQSPQLKELVHFKEELTELSIAVLFILLAARLDLAAFAQLGFGGLFAILSVVLVRAVNIAVATQGLDFSWRERLFMSWVAPRGIVAASMASLFAIKMGEEAKVLEAFTYGVIGMTVVFQGLTAGGLARVLGLRRPDPTGWLIVGAHPFSRRLARFLTEEANVPVWMVDTNDRAVSDAVAEGLNAINANALDVEFREGPVAEQAANILALTDNPALNQLIVERWYMTNHSLGLFYWGGVGPSGKDPKVGTRVFETLPAPSVLGHELEVGEAKVIRRAPGVGTVGDGVVLAALGPDGGATLGGAELPKNVNRLVIKRAKISLKRLFSAQLVTRVESGDQREIFSTLVGSFRALYPKLPADAIVTELLTRERSFSTALGEGLALPHAYSNVIKAPVCAVALVTDGVPDWETPDDVPVKLVFMLLSPKGDAERHLLVLGEIVRMLLEPEVVPALLGSETTGEMARLLTEGVSDPTS